jgi:putative CocE/NonD family hydrolase
MKGRQLHRQVKTLAFLLVSALPLQAQDFAEYQRESLYVPVRDGTRLAMNVYHPVRNGRMVEAPLPVIFMFTPYRARYRNNEGDIVELSQANRMGMMRLLEAGYVLAEADIRGKGASFGARRGFQDRTEAYDGYDLVQWLAQQPWSNGIVGMAGCSYLGGTTVHVASTRPPALKAIFTGASDLDKFDFVRRGGITAQFNTRPDEPLSDDLMSLPLDEDADGSLLRAAVSEHEKNTPMAPLWYGMPFRDSVSTLTGNAFWEEVGPYTYLKDLQDSGIATYFWSNLKDEPTSQVILAAANLDSRLLIGPGTHCVPPPGYDLGGEIQQFFDFHLKGIDNGYTSQPRTRLWVENEPLDASWKTGNFLPGDAAQTRTWFLAPMRSGTAGSVNDGSLTSDRPAAASQQMQVDYDVGSDEYFAFWSEAQDEHGLTFTSETLGDDMHLEGYPVAHLTLESSDDDMHVFVYLEEVNPAGDADVLAMGRLAASYRAKGIAPYDTLGLPWHPGRKADHQPLEPGEKVSLDISLLPVSHIVPAGSRLRLTITGADPRQRNLEDIRREPAPVMTLHLGGGYAAALDLPVLTQ